MTFETITLIIIGSLLLDGLWFVLGYLLGRRKEKEK